MKTIYFAILTLFLGQAVFAADCSDYPLSEGVVPVTVEGGVKLKSTAMAVVPLDDINLVKYAKETATRAAKIAIPKFLREDLAEECNNEDTTLQTVKVTNEGGSADFENVKKTVCSLTTLTEETLRGALVIGDCYTPGKFVLVTVGIKPETIAAAEKLSHSIEKSINSSPSTDSNDGTSTSTGSNDGTSTSTGSSNLNPVEGSSNTSNLDKF